MFIFVGYITHGDRRYEVKIEPKCPETGAYDLMINDKPSRLEMKNGSWQVDGVEDDLCKRIAAYLPD